MSDIVDCYTFDIHHTVNAEKYEKVIQQAKNKKSYKQLDTILSDYVSDESSVSYNQIYDIIKSN